MANEIENAVHAALRVSGLNNGATVLSGQGVIDASVSWISDGVYEFDLEAGIADSEVVCAASVEALGGPLTAAINVEQVTDTRFRVRTFDDASPAVATDAQWSVVLYRARTGA